MNEWIPYNTDGANAVPMELWGKDHWSTFAYLETRVVDHDGIVNNANMRTNPRLHRELCSMRFGQLIDGSKYPTRLKNDEEMPNHDDWSCLEDFCILGLIKAYFRVVDIEEVFGNSEVCVHFTIKGLELTGQLRRHKANGGNFSNFEPNLKDVEMCPISNLAVDLSITDLDVELTKEIFNGIEE